MNIPGFTADASLRATKGRYGTCGVTAFSRTQVNAQLSRPINSYWGIYLTQVTPRCSMAGRGGLSKESG